MSNLLSTFIMRGSGMVVGDEEMEVEEGRLLHHPHHTAPPQPLPPTTPTQYPTFLPATAPSLTPSAPTTSTTFLTGPTDTFLTLPEQVEGEGEGVELLGSGEGEGEGEGVPQGSLLYLDSNSALHVLVHHLPQSAHQQPTPPQLVEEEGSQEQFVVVGALKTDDLGAPSPPTPCHVSVERYLDEDMAGGEGGEIYLPQTQDPTPAPPQHLPSTPVLTLVGGGGDGGEEDASGGTGITLNRVPHITLEEIIQKFASSPDSPMSDSTDPSTTTTTTITALIPPSPPPPPVTSTANLSPRVKVKLLPETVKDDRVEGEGDGDEGCLYDVVVTYRCRVCGEGFEDKGHLLQHHHLRHKQGGTIRIRVTTSTTTTTTTTNNNNTRCPLTPPSQPPSPEKDHREISIHSCGFCSEDFLGSRECKEHINKEHPSKRPREGGPRQYTPRGSQVKYPPQPGILIGHRKARSPGQEETTGPGGGGGEEGEEVEGKRKVKTPRALQEQFWLQKQRPKPVCSMEVEKKHKCSLPTCKYKFSSEANLDAHKECHGGGGGKGGERGFSCSQCGFRCDKWSVCQLHLWKDHALDIDLLTCGICHTYKTCTQQRLLVHQKIHSDVRDHICTTCGKGFKQLAQLLNHQVAHITDPKDMPAWADKAFCEECQKWFRDRKSFQKHNALVHLKVKPHACPHCPYRSTDKYSLTVHMRQHTGERPHRCPLCGWQTSDHNTMRRHKLGHQDSKPFRCPIAECALKTRNTSYFRRHMAKRHPSNEMPFKCEFCPLQTTHMEEYIPHCLRHEKELIERKLKQARELALENEADNITSAPVEQTALTSTTTPATTTTTTSVIKTKTDAIRKHLSAPILLNPRTEVITIKIDADAEDAKGGDGGVVGDGMVVGEGEAEAVPLPQVVMSENNGHYIIGLSEFNAATNHMTQSNGDCQVVTTYPHHRRKEGHHQIHHPHSASPVENIQIT
ncbi:uncharacterized protein LOC127009982 [Eriocheir sinensis]|uniref:uncharacterized protein LOC127009982 n=1 Tax=Eriocheir sinensis TaxID=95602 RepID=UPI0021C908A2|nr:uncharacterized protein LOC127009982 [Eriocheir sinensis]